MKDSTKRDAKISIFIKVRFVTKIRTITNTRFEVIDALTKREFDNEVDFEEIINVKFET